MLKSGTVPNIWDALWTLVTAPAYNANDAPSAGDR